MQFSAKKDALYISFRRTGRTPDDLLELVGVRRKEMYKAIIRRTPKRDV